MPEWSDKFHGRGYLAAILGYDLGVVVGVVAGIAVARSTAAGDLSDIGSGFLWLTGGALAGILTGTWVALAVAGTRGGLITGLLASTITVIGVFAAGAAIAATPDGSFLERTVGIISLGALVVGVPLASRWLTIKSSKPLSG